jgi:hypothetical protein
VPGGPLNINSTILPRPWSPWESFPVEKIYKMQHLEGSGVPVLYIGRVYRYPPAVAFYIFFSTNVSTEYFKHAAHAPFFSSKCLLFHNATFFGFCIIHILHTGCAEI